MAGKTVGKVLKLFISKSGTSQRFDKNNIVLDELGVIEDKFYNTNKERSVLIASIYSYKLIQKYGIDMPNGYLGENILIDYNPYSLKIGTQLKIGEAILEISQACTICNHLATLDVKIPTLLKDDRGVFAKVIKKGEITKDDSIILL